MLPTHVKVAGDGARAFGTGYKGKGGGGGGFATWARLTLRNIMSDRSSRNLFLFLCLNLSFTGVEMLYGMWTNSLGLITDAFHMLFDCSALLLGLAAAVVAKWPATQWYTYGYGRAEILAGFLNGTFLLFVAFFVFTEALERIWEPPEVKTDDLFAVSTMGFLVNLVGIFALGHGHSHEGSGGSHGHGFGGGDSHGHSHGQEHHGHDHGHDDHGHGHGNGHDHSHGHGDAPHGGGKGGRRNAIMQGVFLHVLADTLGSVGVIISSTLMDRFGWYLADPICSLIIAVLISLSTYPLIKESLGVLMMRVPRSVDDDLAGCYHKVQAVEGVIGIQDPHFWTFNSNSTHGTVTLLIEQMTDDQRVLRLAQSIFRSAGIEHMTIQLERQ